MSAASLPSRFLSFLRTAPAKWRRRSPAERLLLLEAFVLLGCARLLVLTVPFRWLARTLGEQMRESPPEAGPEELRIADLVGSAVRSAAGNTPWESVCLPQAVAGQWMLRRRRIVATVYFGVAKDAAKTETLAAHAWLRCGDAVITGAAGHRQYTVVSMFSPLS